MLYTITPRSQQSCPCFSQPREVTSIRVSLNLTARPAPSLPRPIAIHLRHRPNRPHHPHHHFQIQLNGHQPKTEEHAWTLASRNHVHSHHQDLFFLPQPCHLFIRRMTWGGAFFPRSRKKIFHDQKFRPLFHCIPSAFVQPFTQFNPHLLSTIT